MSRRKQPNPKFAKRDSDFEELACLVHLPTDLLYVKEPDPKEGEEEEEEITNDAHNHTTRCAIFAKKDLKANTVLATYKRQIRSADSDNSDVGNCLELNDFESGYPVHVMIEDDGHWLKLIRKPTPTSDANICLRITCSDVVCRVTKDVSRDVELRVTCQISDRITSDKRPDVVPDQTNLNEENGENCELRIPEAESAKTSPCRSIEMVDTFLGAQDSDERDTDTIFAKESNFRVNTTIISDNDNKSFDNNSLATTYSADRHEISEEVVSPSSDILADSNMANRTTEATGKDTIPSQVHSDNSFDVDDGFARSPNTVCGETTIGNQEQLYECPSCDFQTHGYSTLTKHTKLQHMSSDKSKCSNESGSSTSAYCDACNIQFMSAKTYRVHKEFYCKSRHEQLTSNIRQCQATSEVLSHEDVFVSLKKHHGAHYTHTNGIMPNVIHPQAIFAAISTDPLILLPCSLVNGQGLVPQNSLISTGVPIVLPNGIPNTAIVENGSISTVNLNQNCNKTNKCVSLNNVVYQNTATNSGTNDSSDNSTDKKCDDVNVLNLTKTRGKDLSKTNANSIISDDAPLDLTVRKRKTSCFEVQRSEPRSILKRRNSFASVSPTTPPLRSSPVLNKSTHSPSPEPQYLQIQPSHSSLVPPRTTAVSPPTFSNDASNSSGFGASSAPTLTKSDVHGLCNAQDECSPVPPVLFSVLENVAGANTRRTTTVPFTLPSPKLLKHGNNRCEDCNIVFYKYDNYLAHKKHYCAYRRRQLANQLKEDLARAGSDVSSSDENSGSAGQQESKSGDEKSSGKLANHHLDFALENLITIQHPVVSKPLQSAIFRCDACGVKFSTADNLNAHQTYYCSRKSDFSYPNYSNNNISSPRNNAKSRGESTQSCATCGESGDSHEEMCWPEEWKCSYCDIVCPSLKSARRHLLTHSEIRGFCCIVCGYRGNTLRGMRGHVYEHLNGDASQIEDILASSVVVDPITPGRRTMDFSGDDDSNVSTRENKQLVGEHKDTDLKFTTNMSCKVENRDNAASDECSFSPQHKAHNSSSVSPNSLTAHHQRESPTLNQTPNTIQDGHCAEKMATEEDSNTSDNFEHRNVGVMCDVLIKTETEDYPSSPEKIVPERENSSSGISEHSAIACHIKEDPLSSREEIDDDEEEEIDVEESMDKMEIKTEAPVTSAATSVICRVTSCRDGDKVNNEITRESPNSHLLLPKKRKLKTNSKAGLELKYCKSCDISFHQLSNFIAHKKFYCVSRVIENFQQEAAPVQ